LASEKQVLCVVNLTRHAAKLWEELLYRLSPNERPIHLSSSMCPQHRFDLIDHIRQQLKTGTRCHVISTQLIEAGVDVDFPVVWRALGPLDSIVQVAGRCNREGRVPMGEMHIFRPLDHKLPQGVYRNATELSASTLDRLCNSHSASEQLATDPKLFSRYFEELYQVVNTDYTRPGELPIQKDRENLRYREVSRKARVIEDQGQPVIVLYGKSSTIIDEIRNRPSEKNQPRFTREDLRRLQRFMVNVRGSKFEYLRSSKIAQVEELLPNLELFVLKAGSYHPELGLVIDNRPLEDFIL
jgi:CRISPR-associated endonuclease/helicase Cas3